MSNTADARVWADQLADELADFVAEKTSYEEAKKSLLALVEAASIYSVPMQQAGAEASWCLREMYPTEWMADPWMAKDTAGFKRMSNIETRPVFWLWGSRIPTRRVTVLDGDPGLGKSTLTVDIAARVSTGAAYPDGWQAEAGAVIFLSAEDGLADTVKPRLEAAGADLSQIIAIEAIARTSGFRSPPDIRDDLPAIGRLVDERTRLLIVDPLMAYLPEGVNPHSDHEIRRCLFPLSEFASKTGVAVLLVRHLRKTDKKESALYAGGGSIGISGAARSVLLVAKHPENPYRRVLAAVKTNLCMTPPSLAFTIEADDNGQPTIAWENFCLSISADELIAARRPQRKVFDPN